MPHLRNKKGEVENMTDKEYYCPECGHKVTKAGGAWSGRTKLQQFRCLKCGRVTTKPYDERSKPIDAIPFNHAEAKP
jgi:ribosomal protein L37AE/L43A